MHRCTALLVWAVVAGAARAAPSPAETSLPDKHDPSRQSGTVYLIRGLISAFLAIVLVLIPATLFVRYMRHKPRQGPLEEEGGEGEGESERKQTEKDKRRSNKEKEEDDDDEMNSYSDSSSSGDEKEDVRKGDGHEQCVIVHSPGSQ